MKFLKIYVLLFILFASMSSKAQMGLDFDIDKDPNTGNTMFIGRCLFEDLADDPNFAWMISGSKNYKVNESVTEELKKILPSCELIIFMGTWCEDTQDELPKLYQTMLYAHCYTNYKMYAVNREKQSKRNEEKSYNITNVPTIIVMKNGKELGRIVEHPQKSFEQDLLDIVRTQ